MKSGSRQTSLNTQRDKEIKKILSRYGDEFKSEIQFWRETVNPETDPDFKNDSLAFHRYAARSIRDLYSDNLMDTSYFDSAEVSRMRRMLTSSERFLSRLESIE